MAFGDALRGNTADVVLTADTGRFNAEIDQAERNWRESINSMSKEALKLDLANDRLRKSLAKYGAESVQAKRATIGLKEAEEAAARAADKQTRETEQLNRTVRATNSSFASMRNRVVGLAAAYVGTYGLVAGIRSAISAAKEEQIVRGQTSIAVAAAGLAYEKYEAQIQSVIRAQSKLGFDDEALLRTFQMFVRSTRDVSKALELNALAADVARGRYIDLEQAAQIVNKANLGMSGALRRIGLDVEKNATRTQLLATLQRNYGKAAEQASDTAVAASDRLAVEWENMQEILGAGLLPAVTNLSDRLADYFGDAENQRKVQQRVNEAIETGEDVVRGLAGAIKTVSDVMRPFVNVLGGAESAARLFFIAFAASKFAGIVGSVRGLNAALALLGPTSVRSAATSVAAMNTIGAAATVNAGKVGILRGALAGLGGALGIGITGGLILNEIGDARNRQSHEASMKKLRAAADQGLLNESEIRNAPDFALSDAEKAELIRRNRAARKTHSSDGRAGRGRTGHAPTHRLGDDPSEPDKPPTSTKPGPRTMVDILLDQAIAATTATDADDLRYHREAEALIKRKIAATKNKEKLTQLYRDLAAEQSAIEAIIDAREAEADRKTKAAQDKREKRAKERAANAKRSNDIVQRAIEEYDRASRGSRGNQGLTDRGTSLAEAARKKAAAGGATGAGGLSQETVRAQIHDLLTGLHGVVSGFGSNFAPDGGGATAQVATHAYVQTQLLRDQNRTLNSLQKGLWHPGARYSSAELSVAGLGVGF